MKTIIFTLVTVLSVSIAIGKNKVYVLNPENDFPIFTQKQIDTLNQQICIDVENKLNPYSTMGIYTYRIYNLHLHDRYHPFGLKIKDMMKNYARFYVIAESGYMLSERKGVKQREIVKTMVSATSLILNEYRQCICIYYKYGIIPVEKYPDSDLILYAFYKKKILGIEWYFKMDINDYLLGVTSGGIIYVFYKKDGIFYFTTIDEFPEDKIRKYVFDNEKWHPELREGVKKKMRELINLRKKKAYDSH